MTRCKPSSAWTSPTASASRYRRYKMKTELIETGALIVRAHKGTPFYEAKWRDGRKRQRKRRLGRAWLEPDPRGGWKRRRGRSRTADRPDKTRGALRGCRRGLVRAP